MTYTDGSSRIRDVFFALCKSVDTPISLGCWLRFKHAQRELASVSIDARLYLNASDFARDYAVVSFLSKWKGLQTGLDTKAEALQRFTTSEDVCRETNNRLRRFARAEESAPGMHAVFHCAARKIASLLGPFSVFKVDEYGWGPGATNVLRRRSAQVDQKLCQTPFSVTRRALHVSRRELRDDLHWSSVILGVGIEDIQYPFSLLPSVFVITDENVITTVPKNAKTDRVIAMEPTLNGFLQKGVGAYIRKRLKSVGVDLDDQSANQRAARAALWDCLATLDLKAASDTIAKELVYQLLPIDWAIYLDDLRSPYGLLPDGRRILYEKFSSMGNGFTFELESLIFWALVSSVVDLDFATDSGRVWVYGDDIVCPSRCAQRVIDVLAFCGFSVNTDKTFTDGQFYESCGKHYFGGHDVTPTYQKDVPSNPLDEIRLANRILRMAVRLGDPDHLRDWCRQAWLASIRGTMFARFQIPLGTDGDDAWLAPCDYFEPRPQDINLGLRCSVLRPKTRTLPGHSAALLAWSLRRGVVTETPFLDSVNLADGTRPPSKGARWVMPTWVFGLSW